MDDSILLAIEGAAAVLTINRPRRRNALDSASLRMIDEALTRCRSASVATLVVRGEGDTAFCAGADVKEMAAMTPAESAVFTDLGQRLMDRLEETPFVTIAAIEGYCLGGGLELALACDLRVAGEGATIGFPEIRLDAFPTWGGTVRLPRMVGPARARDMILRARMLSAAEALGWGLLTEVVPQGAALGGATKLAAEIAGQAGRPTIAAIKGLLVNGAGASSGTARHMEFLADSARLALGGHGASERDER